MREEEQSWKQGPSHKDLATKIWKKGVPQLGSGTPVNSGGPEGARTPDLCIANAALSQLSYRP